MIKIFANFINSFNYNNRLSMYKIPKNIIEREAYTSRIKPFMNKPLIKVLTGQRRVGKSYLLFQIMRIVEKTTINANIIYINCEDMAFDFIDSARKLNDYLLSQINPAVRNYIFIDEIQDIPDFEKTLRSIILKDYNDVYITGSNAKMLSGELASYLSGRHIEIEIFSLSYTEFLLFHRIENDRESYLKYIRFGGLPYLIHLELKEEIVAEYLKNIYTTIIYRDVVSRYNLRDTAFLERLTYFIADNIGSIFSSKNISDFLKSQKATVSVNQVQNYTGYLVNAFLIHQVKRYDIAGKKIFEVGEKYYFENLGIRNAIAGYKIEDRGKILENVIYNHLLYKGYSVKVGISRTNEIDFVCERKAEKLYIQAALKINDANTINREFGNLLKIQDNYPKLVITEEEFKGNTYKGIIHMNVLYFLSNENGYL